MDRWTLLKLVLGVVLILTSFGTALAQETRDGPDPNRFDDLIEKAHDEGEVRIIIEVAELADQGAVLDLVADLDASLTVRYQIFPLLAMTSGPEALEALARAPLVIEVREDVEVPPALSNTRTVINADDVHGLGWTGSGYAVAILDTGIDAGSPFFTGRIVAEACFSSDDGIRTTLCPNGSTSQTGAGSSDATVTACINPSGNNICDHGTHVAGIAAGAASGAPGDPGHGVAPGADIISIQVFHRIDDDPDDDNTPCADNNRPSPCVLTSASNQILGLQQVALLSVFGNFDIAAANMSLGGGESATACDGDSRKLAIDLLLALGIPTVIASGNDGFLNSVSFPACISTAVTVGNSTNADAVAGSSNRGPLLDLFAPGTSVVSADISATGFGTKSGTSMAAPHVAGAFAILMEAYPTASVATLLAYMQDTGVDITYSIGGGNTQTTPRLNLLAALQEGNSPPTVGVNNATVTVDEGQTATNTGTFSDPDGDPVTLSASVGAVTDTGGGNWSWSFQTNDGPAQSQTVTITATDDKGESGTADFELVVENVDPVVTIQNADVTIDEGDSINLVATYTDPGWVDTHTAEIDWGHPDLDVAPTLVADPVGPPEASGTVTATQQFGDRGVFEVTVTVTDKDGGVGSDSFTVTVNNVDPTAEIDLTGAVVINGEPTFLSQAGVENTFSGRSTDPGSDDLEMNWDFGDGNGEATIYLVNPPNVDPFPSPSNQPRDVTDTVNHTYADACFYLLGFWAEDDDGGISPTDEASVIIVGNADQSRSAGYWQHQYRGNGRIDFSEAQLQCYLDIVGYMSNVFNEERSASNADEAYSVLFPGGGGGDMLVQLDRQILAAWLNFANGAIGYDQMIDTTGNGVGDTLFSDVMSNAENVRLNPGATQAQLEEQKNILERMNGN